MTEATHPTDSDDGSLVLTTPREDAATALGFFLFVCVTTLAMALTGHDEVLGWFVAVWSGAMSIMAALAYVWPPGLEITERGFRMTGRGQRPAFVAWSECRDFRIYTRRYTSRVVFDYDGSDPRWRGRRAWANVAMAHANGCLPTTYGMAADDLAALLEQRRQVAWGGAPTDDAGAARA